MATSAVKTIGQALQRTGGFKVERSERRVCDQHGEYLSNKYFCGWSPCPKCIEELHRAEDEDRRKRDAADRVQAKIKRLYDRAAIPPRFESRTLDNFRVENDGQRKAMASARKYISEFDLHPGVSMIFCGGVGAGKTHIAVGIAKSLMGTNHSALFMSVIGAVRSIKETWGNRDRSEREALNDLIEPDLLILDEVGVQFGSDAEKLILFEIINGRYENCRSTILISNLAIQSLTEYLGERVVDRLREGGGRMVLFDWGSYRGHK